MYSQNFWIGKVPYTCPLPLLALELVLSCLQEPISPASGYLPFFFFFKTSFLRRNHTRCFGDSPSISCVLKRQIAKLNHCFLCKTLCFPRPKGKQQFLYPSFSVWSSLQSHFELLWFYFSLCLFIFGLWVSGLSNSRWKRN